MANKPLLLRVHNREGLLFSGEAKTITSSNEKGKFDVLSMHANFISLINNFVIIRKEGDDVEQRFNFEQGVMRVKDDVVDIYLGVKELKAPLNITYEDH